MVCDIVVCCLSHSYKPWPVNSRLTSAQRWHRYSLHWRRTWADWSHSTLLWLLCSRRCLMAEPYWVRRLNRSMTLLETMEELHAFHLNCPTWRLTSSMSSSSGRRLGWSREEGNHHSHQPATQSARPPVNRVQLGRERNQPVKPVRQVVRPDNPVELVKTKKQPSNPAVMWSHHLIDTLNLLSSHLPTDDSAVPRDSRRYMGIWRLKPIRYCVPSAAVEPPLPGREERVLISVVI